MSVQTPWTLAVILCITLGISPVKAATISEPPGDDEINLAIAETLPGYWGLHSSILTGPVDYGNAIEPDWRWRFETVITPKEPLFFEGEKRDNVVLLQPTLAPDSQETLYGIVRATFHAGNWNIEIGHENQPFDSRGLPASFFPGRTIVIGSPEEKVELERAREHELEALQTEHKKELLVLKNEQDSALAKAEETHRAALAAAQADRDAKLAALNTEQETALAATAETHRTALAAFRDALAVAQVDRDAKLAALNTEQETALAATAETHRTALAAFRDALAVAQADRDAKLAALNTEREEALAEIAETHRTTLAALKIEREKATAEITKAHRATLAALESELKAKAEKHRIEIAQAEALTELAATATHKLVVLHEKEAEMLAATEQLFDTRQAALNDLVAKLDTSANVESYEILLKSVAGTGSDWLFEAVMRHGLNSDDQAIRQAAWIHLIRTDLEGAASLRTALTDHVADLSENPRLGAFLGDHLSGPSETPRLLGFLANHVQALVGSPEALQALAGSPEAIQALLGNPEALQALAGSPEALQALAGSPEALQALAGSPEAIQALRELEDGSDLRNLVADHMERDDWIFVDLESKSNTKLIGNDWATDAPGDTTLSRLPVGKVADFEGPDGKAKFKIIDGAIVVFGTKARQRPKKVEGIVVEAKAKFIYFLHATGWDKANATGYAFVMNYRDGKKEELEMISGFNSDDWCHDGARLQDHNSVWGWVKKGGRHCGHAGLITTKWKNPHPDIWIDTIDIVSRGLRSVPVIPAITLGEATLGLP